MKEKNEQTDWSSWFSTYGLLTSERILERFNIHVSHDTLINEVKNKNSIYFQLLVVPLKNVFNGIILQQASDYQIYAQKLFVDYLLSGEDAKDKDSPGADTRSLLEEERLTLIATGEEFRIADESHQLLIAKTQTKLVELTKDLSALVRDPMLLQQQMSTYLNDVEDINVKLRYFRGQFYRLILRITELLATVGDYRLDEEKLEQNLSKLEFDPSLGEEVKTVSVS